MHCKNSTRDVQQSLHPCFSSSSVRFWFYLHLQWLPSTERNDSEYMHPLYCIFFCIVFMHIMTTEEVLQHVILSKWSDLPVYGEGNIESKII